MNQFRSHCHRQTRKAARVLAGVIAAFLLLVSFPVSLFDVWNGDLSSWLVVVCSGVAGIGLASGARTGRWFNSPA